MQKLNKFLMQLKKANEMARRKLIHVPLKKAELYIMMFMVKMGQVRLS